MDSDWTISKKQHDLTWMIGQLFPAPWYWHMTKLELENESYLIKLRVTTSNIITCCRCFIWLWFWSQYWLKLLKCFFIFATPLSQSKKNNTVRLHETSTTKIPSTTTYQEPLERGRINPQKKKKKTSWVTKNGNAVFLEHFRHLQWLNHSSRLEFVTKALVCPPSSIHDCRAEQIEKENEGRKFKHKETKTRKELISIARIAPVELKTFT